MEDEIGARRFRNTLYAMLLIIVSNASTFLSAGK